MDSQRSGALTEGQVRTAARVLTAAFRDDPAFTTVFPDPGQRLTSLPRLWRAVVVYCLAHGRADTTPDVTAVACWLAPGNTNVTLWRMLRARLLLPRAILGFDRGARRRFFQITAHLDGVRRQRMTRPHWYLWALGVEPSVQGRGLGGRLLQPVLARADAEGVPCYLETQTERNLGFYERYGFAVVDEGEVRDLGLRLWAMAREARR